MKEKDGFPLKVGQTFRLNDDRFEVRCAGRTLEFKLYPAKQYVKLESLTELTTDDGFDISGLLEHISKADLSLMLEKLKRDTTVIVSKRIDEAADAKLSLQRLSELSKKMGERGEAKPALFVRVGPKVNSETILESIREHRHNLDAHVFNAPSKT